MEKTLSPLFLNIDKPAGMTSHDVVARLRCWTKIKRIGHAGTLDPDATGVLPVALGSATRLIPYLASEKIYLAEILLGVSTTTDDLSGTIIEENALLPSIDETQIASVLSSYTGLLDQKPSLYSSVHHKGQRLYDWARAKLKNQNFSKSEINETLNNMLAEVKTRVVNVEKIELLSVNLPVVQLRIFCSSGTYIRALARDIGRSIGCGACLKSLRREQSGLFNINGATHLDKVESLIKSGQVQEILLTPSMVLGTRVIPVTAAAAARIGQGQSIALETIAPTFPAHDDAVFVPDQYCLAVYAGKSGLNQMQSVALCLITAEKYIKPKVVLSSAEDLNLR